MRRLWPSVLSIPLGKSVPNAFPQYCAIDSANRNCFLRSILDTVAFMRTVSLEMRPAELSGCGWVTEKRSEAHFGLCARAMRGVYCSRR
jgi:hypothetical protein